jgi:hypothetical protein
MSLLPDPVPSRHGPITADARVHSALQRDPGVSADKRVRDLSPRERYLYCAWLLSGTRYALSGPGQYECANGSRGFIEPADQCTDEPIAACEASVGQVVECARSRLDPLCGVDAPSCAVADTCRWGIYRL